MNDFERALDLIEPGDLVFTRIDNILFKKVAATSESWTSHVGIYIGEVDGEPSVAESKVPRCKISSLKDFVKRSEKQVFAIRRHKEGLSSEEFAKMKELAFSRLGQWYHFRFDYDSSLQFCSKFVYDLYREGANKNAGELETFEELLQRNPRAPMFFWNIWFLWKIPMKRRTVTPANQLESKDFIDIFDNSSGLDEA